MFLGWGWGWWKIRIYPAEEPTKKLMCRKAVQFSLQTLVPYLTNQTYTLKNRQQNCSGIHKTFRGNSFSDNGWYCYRDNYYGNGQFKGMFIWPQCIFQEYKMSKHIFWAGTFWNGCWINIELICFASYSEFLSSSRWSVCQSSELSTN